MVKKAVAAVPEEIALLPELEAILAFAGSHQVIMEINASR
jgi:hypothetical protein